MTLVLLVLFGMLAAFFAMQNTTPASINIVSYTLKDIPMYLIVLGSLLIGLLSSLIIGLVNSIGSSFMIHGKDVKIKEGKKTVADLTKQIHQLELENTKLKEHTVMTDEKSL
jgi:uncharacterized integral membrane protein